MDKELTIQSIVMLITFLIGLYAGIFFGEAEVMFQCEKDQHIAISGQFWKGVINYECKKGQP